MRSFQFVVGAAALVAAVAPLHAQQRDSSRARREQTIVRTMRAADSAAEGRAALGLSTQSSGARDSLGLLIVEVVSGGPADKAGLQEGDRIMAINGVNLKLAPGDAGEPDMRGLTTRRLVRELEKVKAGDDVKLSIYADGRTKSMTVKAARAGDVYKDLMGRGFRFYFGGEGVAPMPPMSPMPPMPPSRELQLEIESMMPRVRAEVRAAREAVRASEAQMVAARAAALKATRSLRCQCQ